MKRTNQDVFQKLRDKERVYCLTSGPLNSKTSTFSAVLLIGLNLVAAALAALAIPGYSLSFYIVSSPVSISGSSIEIPVNVHNMPEDGQLSYGLSPALYPEPGKVRTTRKTGDPDFFLFHLSSQSKMRPSTEMVTTCHGINFPLACRAFLAASSSPPQQGTSILTIVKLWILLLLMISVSFSL